MPSFKNFLYTQLIAKIPMPTSSFAPKTVIITGSNTDLGKEAARHVARLGASNLIIACRNISKGNNARLEIDSSVKCRPDVIEVWNSTLSLLLLSRSLLSVHVFCLDWMY